jgi:nicotinate-nucleotide--dimethylbenzimidazole phosphoribosyltransferase
VSEAIRRHLDRAARTGPDAAAAAALAQRAARVLRPAGALAALDEVAVWLAAWQRRSDPRVDRPSTLVFVADHGVSGRGVSAYPAAVTTAMLGALQAGVATASALSRQVGADLVAIDVGVGRPTGDLATEDALDHARFDEAWFAGVDAVSGLDADLLVLGEMGIGNTTAAAAVAAALFGGGSEPWCGRGTGIDDEALGRKRRAVAAAVERIGPDPAPLDVLRRVGGAELAAIAGAAAEARRRSLPLLLDGFITTAAVASLARAVPGFLDHAWAGHRSAEPGHGRLLGHLGKRPLLTLDLRLGEASGALVALPLVRAAAAAVVDVATFDEAGVPGPVG